MFAVARGGPAQVGGRAGYGRGLTTLATSGGCLRPGEQGRERLLERGGAHPFVDPQPLGSTADDVGIPGEVDEHRRPARGGAARVEAADVAVDRDPVVEADPGGEGDVGG